MCTSTSTLEVLLSWGGFLFHAFGKRLLTVYRLGFLVLMITVAVMGNPVDSITGDCSAEELELAMLRAVNRVVVA